MQLHTIKFFLHLITMHDIKITHDTIFFFSFSILNLEVRPIELLLNPYYWMLLIKITRRFGKPLHIHLSLITYYSF